MSQLIGHKVKIILKPQHYATEHHAYIIEVTTWKVLDIQGGLIKIESVYGRKSGYTYPELYDKSFWIPVSDIEVMQIIA